MGIAPSELALRRTGTPMPNFLAAPNFEIPLHLEKTEIKRKRDAGLLNGRELMNVWSERGSIIEQRVQSILADEKKLIRNVHLNPPLTPFSDLTVEFKSNFILDKVRVEVKSTGYRVQDYKRDIQKLLPEQEKNESGVRKWLTNNEIILINGSERKTPQEILVDSFYPQLERIIYKRTSEVDFGLLTQIFPG